MTAKRKTHQHNTRTGGRRPAESRQAPQQGLRRSLAVPALAAILVIAGAWAYANSFGGALVLDDIRGIAFNESIRTVTPISKPLAPPTATTVAGRPVANLTFAINYALAPVDARTVFAATGLAAPPDAPDRFARNVWGYHLFNLLIHLAAGLALFGVVRRTLLTEPLRSRFGEPSPWLAFVVALLWLLHPLQTESVTYLVQRVESLMGLFYLLTLYCAIRASEPRAPGAWIAAAVACCGFGMATKEVMVTAPVMVAAWLWFFSRPDGTRRHWALLGGLAATWFVLAVLLVYEHRAPSIDMTPAIVWRYAITQAGVVLHYLRLSFVPAPLVFIYTWPLAPSVTAVLPDVAIIGALLAAAVLAGVRRSPLGFLGAWFFLILAPSSSVVPIVSEVATEHRMYLPLAAVIALAVIGLFTLGRAILARLGTSQTVAHRLAPVVGAVLTVVLAASLGTLTRARNLDYASAETLWQDTLEKQPANARAHVAYGTVLSAENRLTEAAAQYQAAIDLDPNDAVAVGSLGAVEATMGNADAAIGHLERSLALRPDDLPSHRWLGEAYAMKSQDARAIPHLERALAEQQDDAMLLMHLATILADSPDVGVRNPARAVEFAERAATLTARQNPRVLDVLAVAQAGVGRFRDAAATANEALQIARRQGNRALTAELEYRAAAYRARSES